jgi:hypothetical protein
MKSSIQYLILFGLILFRMRNVTDRSSRVNQNTCCVLNIAPHPHPTPKNHAVYKITWENNIEPDRPQMTIWHMQIACRIRKATYTHSEYVIFIAFPLQQWLHKCIWMLHFYVHCLSCLLLSLIRNTGQSPYSKWSQMWHTVLRELFE